MSANDQPANQEDEYDYIWNDPPRRHAVNENETSENSSESDEGSEDSYFQASDNDSEDSAVRERRTAEERIKDYGSREQQPKASVLPSAAHAFAEVQGPPAFLDPDATRPLADTLHRSQVESLKQLGKQKDDGADGSDRGKGAQSDWDIAQMAPKLKGDKATQSSAVIAAAPVRYKTDDRVGIGEITAAQVAMLGGHVHEDREDGDGLRSSRGTEKRDSGRTAPMAVPEFLEKGVGGAQLPRKRQDRKDKEKVKRSKGQSSIGNWKTEAEMVLRQQYD